MSCGKEHTFGAEERGRDKNKSPASRFQDCHEPPFALKFDIEVYHDLSPLTSAPNVLFTYHSSLSSYIVYYLILPLLS